MQLLGSAALVAGRGLRRTLRLNKYRCDPKLSPWTVSRGAIFCMWHENILPGVFVGAQSGLRALISQSRDGDLITQFVQGFQLEAIRGSSTRGAVRAIREMVRSCDKHSILITPDGPRGPRRVFQPGAVYLASRTGLPLVPLSMALSATYRLPSWDRMAIPKPFSHCLMISGHPLHVPDDLDVAGLEEYCGRITAEMDAVEAYAADVMSGKAKPPEHGTEGEDFSAARKAA